MEMKKWVNVFIDCYDETQYYVSKSYMSEQQAKDNVRASMKARYVSTIELNFPEKILKISETFL